MFTLIETKLFTKLVGEYLSVEEYRRLQLELMARPDTGAVIRGSGGVRKMRWSAQCGGYRVIYLVRPFEDVIWMLTIYPKNIADTVPVHILRQIRQEIEDDTRT